MHWHGAVRNVASIALAIFEIWYFAYWIRREVAK
jgi:uncharacterized membrane protein